MASPASKRGFATLWATVICLGLAAVVAAVVTYASTANRAAMADIERVQAEALLDSGHLLAALGVFENVQPGRLRWREMFDGVAIDILAEPEFEKLSSRESGLGQTAVLSRLGADDPQAAAAWLDAAYDRGELPWIREADPGETWRSCAASALSFYGRAEALNLAPPAEPNRAGVRARSGEVWRVVVWVDGWQDERIVRFTDSARAPTLLIERAVRRAGPMEDAPCASLYTP